jgi:hypothetical protein
MHPETQYELVKMRIAEDLRMAERERLIRRAGSPAHGPALDPIRFRERVVRLFNATWPSTPTGSIRVAGA